MNEKELNFVYNMMRTLPFFSRRMQNIEHFAQDMYGIPSYSGEFSAADYKYLFKKNAIASRIISLYPNECWRALPAITEGDSPKETIFEKEITKLILRPGLKVHQKLKQADVLSGIGRFGILYLGLADGQEPKTPAQRGKELLYLRPFDETNVEILEVENNPSNERYGMPVLYSIKFSDENNSNKETIVHWSRCLHFTENAVDSVIFGQPRLEAVIENVLNVTLLLKGSPHMFMRGGFPGYVFEAEPDVHITSQDKLEMKDQIEQYVQSMTRFLTLQGVNAKSLDVQVSDPEPFIKAQINAISAYTGIPGRILMGSEMGHLASTADKMTFEDRIRDRQESYLSDDVVRPFVKRLQLLEILPETSDDIMITWLKVDSTSQKERAEISKLKAESLKAYADSVMAPAIIPEEYFLKHILNLSPGEVSDILNQSEALALPISEEEEDTVLE
jgi:hypothetical protein